MQMLVSEREIPQLNPGKQFMTSFLMALDDQLHQQPFTPASARSMGADSYKLGQIVEKIEGINGIRISGHELRVYKIDPYSWEDLTKKIRAALIEVYGPITFKPENWVVLTIRRFTVQLKS